MGIKTSSLKYYHTHFYSLLNNLPQVQFQTNLMTRFRDKLKNNERGPIEPIYDIIRLFLPKRTPSFFAEDFPAKVEIQNGTRLHM